MNGSNYIRIFEYEKIRYTDKRSDFKEKHFKQIVKYNEENNNKYFDIIYNGIAAKSYVGIIKFEDLTIEILPKINKDTSLNKDSVSDLLIQMLESCKYITVDHTYKAHLKAIEAPVLLIYFIQFLNEIEQLIHKGLIKKYRYNKDNQTAFKGKLLVAQNIQKNFIHAERFYCESLVYDTNHFLHSILKKALLLSLKVLGSDYQSRINICISFFETIDNKEISELDFEKLKLNRKEEVYSKALDLAKIIILNFSSSLKLGDQNLFTILFDMNRLWEEYIFIILKRYEKEFDYKVSFQNHKKFWNNNSIRPDIVLTKNEQTYVIDTKWKLINTNSPSDQDLKQIFVYNERWESQNSLLLYPKTNQIDSKWINYENYDHGCKIGFVELLDTSQRIINAKNIVEDILNKLQNNET